MRVLVTGATGFIGRHLCPELLRAGYNVRGTYRNRPPHWRSADRIEWIDIGAERESTDWSKSLKGIDYVVHLIGLAHRVGANDAELRDQFRYINVDITHRLARAVASARTVRRLLYVSSAKALPAGEVSSGATVQPDSEYGSSKRVAEELIQAELKDSAVDWCILRPCVVYGEGNLGNMARLIRLVQMGLPLPFGAIKNRRSFVFVGNLTDVIARCLVHPNASRKVFAVSDGEPLSTPELLYALGQQTERGVRLVNVPVALLKRLARIGDTMKKFTGVSLSLDSYSMERLCDSFEIDSSEVRSQLKWVPPFTTRDGIRITMQSHLSGTET